MWSLPLAMLTYPLEMAAGIIPEINMAMESLLSSGYRDLWDQYRVSRRIPYIKYEYMNIIYCIAESTMKQTSRYLLYLLHQGWIDRRNSKGHTHSKDSICYQCKPQASTCVPCNECGLQVYTRDLRFAYVRSWTNQETRNRAQREASNNEWFRWLKNVCNVWFYTWWQ